MATVTKDFKIKYGLVVEGATATVNGNDVLTKSAGDTTYIQGLVGGVANSASVANSIVLRDGNKNFAANVITADLVGDVTGQVSDISNFDADDLSEGTSNLYFTNARSKSAAADLLTNATLTNITITGSGSGLTITAENGVDDSDTDDLTEGTTNLYFSNARAQAALAGSYDLAGAAANALSDAQEYADEAAANAVAAIVDSAPDLLDTLNQLANAIGDDPNFAVTLANSVALKQNILTAGSNIDITGNTISVTSLDTDDVSEGDNLYFTNARAQAATAASYDAAGTAANAIAALDTDDIEEGTSNLYFSNARSKSAAADLLTNATLSNITITGSGSGLTITAENGVGDSDTDDLSEGTSNLYFSNARAVSALQAVTPNFTEVALNSVAKQVAAQLSAPTAGIQMAYSWMKSGYRSAEFLVKVAYGAHTEISKVLFTLDTSDNIAITEYAIVGTNGSASTISAAVSGSNVLLNVTTANNNSTVTVVGTLLV
jgi:predicted RecA/RadA family phage recombinase